MKTNIISDQSLLKILDEAPLPIGIYEGPEHRFVFINKAGAKTIRMTKDQILGRPYAEVLLHAPDRVANVKRVYETGEAFSQKEMPLVVGIDEKHRPITEYVNLLSQPVKDDLGRTLGVASFGIVATSEVMARKRLDEVSSRTAQILDNMNAGFFSLDREWKFTYANPASQTALGLLPSEVIGKHVWTLHPHLIDSEFYHAYHRSMNERVVVEVTNYYAEQDRWYHTVSYPLDDGIAVSFSDITVRKKAEEARALSDERFHTLTEAMPQMVWITDIEGSSIYFNARWLEKTGTTLNNNLGAGWLNVIHPDDREKTWDAWSRAVQTKMYDIEYRVRMADGSYRWHVARGVPTLGEDKKIKQWVGTTTDIHSQKETQLELQRALRSRDEFLSIASHELKTPLTVIKLQCELTERNMKQAPSAERMGRFANTIERNVQRLSRVIDDMLDISRISMGKLNLSPEPVDLRSMLDEVIERMHPLLADAGCDLTYTPGPDETVTVDKFRIEQVIANLLTNCIRYARGKPVVVSSEITPKTFIVRVKDSGDGIAPEDHQRIFERFERATDTAGSAGLGLGLFIVRNIVELHQGTIRVKSSRGQGAEFIVEIPSRP